MIPARASLTAARLDPRALIVLESDHAEPVDAWAVDHYARLLTEQPDADTDPLLVLCDSSGRMRVRRGRHRWLANMRVGRAYVLAIVYGELERWSN
jgi:hypothetical protein